MSLRPLILCLLIAGCGGRDDPYAPIDDALCAWTVKCRSGTVDDEAACRAASAERRARAAYSVGEAIASGRAELDSAARDACVASILGSDCAALALDQCLFVVRGKVSAGGACKDDAECAGGSCARSGASPFPTPGCEGVCRAFPQRGDPCTELCAPEDYCDTTTKVCMARKPAGATCLVGECETGLQCSAAVGSAACRGPGQPGDSCTTFATVERSCALGLYCAGQGTSGTCAHRAGEGEACTRTPECQDGILCVAAADGTATCAQPLAEGATCVPLPTAGGESGCQLGLSCDAASSRCRRLPQPEGHACTDDTGCQTTFDLAAYYCDGTTKVCTRRAAVGEACVPQQVPSASCADGICDSTSRTCVLVCG